MKVSLLDVHRRGDNRDYNGGYGTTFSVGSSWRARLLELARKKGEYFPLLNYGYLAAVLKGNGHEVSLDINTIRKDADLVILQASLIRHREELEYLTRIRSETGARICLVGPLASTTPGPFGAFADTIISGSAEGPFLGLKRLEDLPMGIVPSPRIDDLDVLPYPDWTIYNHRAFTQHPILRARPTAFILGSRSCPYLCNYCPYIAVKKAYQIRKPACVVDELAHLKATYGVRAVMFRDPVFSVNRNWVVELCGAIKARNLGLELGCETRSDRLDEELVDLMFDAGFRVIKIGVESTNIAALEAHKRRPPSVEQQDRIVAYCERKGIRIVAFFILGLPEDTRETVLETIRYSQELNPSLANFTICTPIPGTGFFDEVKDRIYDHDWNNYDNFHPVFRLDHLKPAEVKAYQEQAIVQFYFRFGFLKRYLRRRV
ncbi:MAG: radical SAM protein [Gemmatimonadetes bacterium]|nr:radical SAM protein [Gemmatimonadota bacterium]